MDFQLPSDVSKEELKKIFNKIRKLMLSDEPPSKVTEVPWLIAVREGSEFYQDNERTGKWLIFAGEKEIDELWRKIKKATIEGKLGEISKVSTVMGRKKGNYENHVVCVYTLTDGEDKKRVKRELRELGITGEYSCRLVFLINYLLQR